jgi:hypothetical protein
MPRILILLIVFLLLNTFIFSQSVTNGNFSSGTSGWGCGAEVNTETTYGGSNGGNLVDEVDAAAGLCQTITGFVIGTNYYLSIDATRRTGGCPSPATTNMNVTISGGVLSATITRTNTTFGFVTSGFLFTATSATHTINYAAGAGFGGSTCGMIVDNIVIAASVLPVELTVFEGRPENGVVKLYWQTANEKNNDYFDVERSENGTDFTSVLKVTSRATEGNSFARLDYHASDNSPLEKLTYYRLKQTDKDLSFKYSSLISIAPDKTRSAPLVIFPNPNSGDFYLNAGIEWPTNLVMYDALGRAVYTTLLAPGSGPVKIAIAGKLPPGYYICHLGEKGSVLHAKLIIE